MILEIKGQQKADDFSVFQKKPLFCFEACVINNLRSCFIFSNSDCESMQLQFILV